MGKLWRRLKQVFCTVAAASSASSCVTSGGLPARPLTRGETDMAKTIFGNDIDYNKVHIYNGAPEVAGIFRLSETGLAAITPNGDIYIVDKDAQVSDLSKASAAKRRMLIHEMTHVWQHQHGVDVEREAVVLYFKSSFKYNDCYAYNVDGQLQFKSMNIEQQAHMVEDYFALRETPKGKAPADRDAKIAQFEAVLRPHLPLSAGHRDGPPPKPGHPA